MPQKNIPKKYKDLIRTLQSKKIITNKNDIWFFDSKYTAGTIDIAKDKFGFLIPLVREKGKKDLLIEKVHLFGARKHDLVIAKKTYHKNKTKAKVEMVLENAYDSSIVYLKKSHIDKIEAYNILSDTHVPIVASQKSLKQLPADCLLKIDNSSFCILEVLGVISDPSIDEKISLGLYNKQEHFSEECTRLAQSFGLSVDKSMYPRREDMTHLPFCTIDPVDAKDHDDAIYFDKKTNTLYVAIADVSEYVSDFSVLDKEAYERSFSIYFPHKSIPMLPRELSENICSLREQETRLAFVCKMKLDESLEIVECDFIESVICSVKKYSYEQIDEALETRQVQDEVVNEYLFDLFDLTQQLREKRLKKGYTFVGNDLRMQLDDATNLKSVRLERETPSHSLIEECMLLANQSAAKLIGKRGIFRIHESMDMEKINDLLADLYAIGIQVHFIPNLHALVLNIQDKARDMNIIEYVDKMLIQTQKQAKYAYENIGHFGLGFKEYSHFTSPIRRYPDLALHRLIKAIIKDDAKKKAYLLSELEYTCEQTSLLERESAKVQWDYEDRKFARWASENIGTQIEGIVTDTDKSPIVKTTFPFAGARVFLRSYPYDIQLFDEVTIVVEEVNLLTAKIYASYKEEGE